MKKITLITIAVIVTLFLVSFFILGSSRNQQQPVIPGIPTPTPVPNPILQFFKPPSPTPTPAPLKIVSSDPSDDATGVAKDKTITITFNKPVTENDIVFSIFPNASLSASFSQNQLTLTPLENFTSNFQYALSINNAAMNSLGIIHFSIISTEQIQNPQLPTPTPIIPLQGVYPDIENQGNTYDIQNHPDVFLSNQTPYTKDTFSVTTQFVNGAPVGHYQIIVTLSQQDQTKAKADFVAWIKSFGITDTQIQGLDIIYQ